MKLRYALAALCFALTACGPQELELENDEPQLMGPEDTGRTGVLLDEDLPEVSFAEVEEGYVIDGDVLVPREQIHVLLNGEDVGTTRSALVSAPKKQRWPNATIPFDFDANVSQDMRDLVKAAMNVWENNTPVRFVPRKGQDAYVHIKAWDGSYSYASGAYTGSKQSLVVMRRAVGKSWGRGLVIHELGHAMGLQHEQKRIDRDETVTIHWDNIPDGKKSQFRKYDNGLLLTSYNVHSIMHYGSYAFSKHGRPTITRKDGSTFKQNFGTPTDRDFAGVRKLYAN